MNCQGGSPNALITGNLSIFLSVPITNRIDSAGFTDILLTVDIGLGPVGSNVGAQLVAPAQAVFNGLSFQLSPQGGAVLRIRNVRGNATVARAAPIQIQLSFNGPLLSIFTNVFTVANPLRSLYGITTGRLICTQAGSPMPGALSMTNLFASRTVSSAFRITEGFAAAFGPAPDPANFNANSGLRFVVRYKGFPDGARLYLPDVIVGNDGVNPTSNGEFGIPASGGVYNGGTPALLLARVYGADANGGGGVPVLFAPPASSGTLIFDGANEVVLGTDGSGYAVYEVISGDQFSRQWFIIPTFMSLPPNAVAGTIETQQDVLLGAVSTVGAASISAWIPRFVATTPVNDCAELNDCNAYYFPRLSADTAAISLTANTALSPQPGYIPVRNDGGGVLRWTANASYTDGAGWLRLSPSLGFNNGTVRVDAAPAGLTPGTYRGSVRIDGGLYGTATIAVTLTVLAAPPPNPPFVRSVLNPATEQPGPLIPGSRAIILGERFSTSGNLIASIGGLPVAILDARETRLLVLVPDALAGKPNADIVVSADGNASAAFRAAVSTAAPIIYPGGVINQDNSSNDQFNPALTGTIFQVFATGLPLGGTLNGRIHDQDVLTPIYAGPAPGSIGVQQVNMRIDPLFPTMQTFIYVCGQVDVQRVCSPAVPIWLKNAGSAPAR